MSPFLETLGLFEMLIEVTKEREEEEKGKKLIKTKLFGFVSDPQFPAAYKLMSFNMANVYKGTKKKNN